MRSDIKPDGNVWRRPIDIVETFKKQSTFPKYNSHLRNGETDTHNSDGTQNSSGKTIKSGLYSALVSSKHESSKEDKKYSLPHLVRSLSNECQVQRLTALRVLPAVIKDASLANTAISLEIVEKATTLYRRFRQFMLKQKFQEESLLLKLFLTLSGYPKACKQMAQKNFLIQELYKYILEMHSEQNMAASILCNISARPEAIKLLVSKNNLFASIRKILERNICTIYYPHELWRHMAHVLAEAPEQGVAANLLHTLMNRINNRITDFNGHNAKCIGLMLKHPSGQRVFEAMRGIKVLYELLSPNTPKLDNYENLLMALRNAVRSDTVLFQCREFNDFADILTNLAKTTKNATEQMYCFQIIANLNTVAKLQPGIHERCMHELSRMTCLSGEAEHCRLQLVCGWAKIKLD